MVRAIEGALADARLSPRDIQYVNAHGSGTAANDEIETKAIKRAFGTHAGKLAISSNKSMVGHTLIAAGSVEAVFSLLTLRNGLLPPTINYDVPDPDIPLDVVPNVARAATVKTVLSNSFGFGGQNACVVFSGEPA